MKTNKKQEYMKVSDFKKFEKEVNEQIKHLETQFLNFRLRHLSKEI